MSCLSPAERRREKERRAGRRGRSRRGDREPLASLTSGGHRRVQSHNGRARGSRGGPGSQSSRQGDPELTQRGGPRSSGALGEQSQADVPRVARGGLHAAGSTQRRLQPKGREAAAFEQGPRCFWPVPPSAFLPAPRSRPGIIPSGFVSCKKSLKALAKIRGL